MWFTVMMYTIAIVSSWSRFIGNNNKDIVVITVVSFYQSLIWSCLTNINHKILEISIFVIPIMSMSKRKWWWMFNPRAGKYGESINYDSWWDTIARSLMFNHNESSTVKYCETDSLGNFYYHVYSILYIPFSLPLISLPGSFNTTPVK